MKRICILGFIFAIFFSSCCEEPKVKLQVTKSATNNPYDVFYLNTTIQHDGIDLTINNLHNQDVYAIFSNTTTNTNAKCPSVSPNLTDGEIYRNTIATQLLSETTYNLQQARASTITPLIDTVNDEKQFWILDDYNNEIKISAICKKIICIGDGKKQISFFVQKELIALEQDKIDKLAEKFETIYQYETNVIGEEWGYHNSKDLIQPNNNITILLSNLQTTGNTITLGYFYQVNNYKKSKHNSSNERIMFILNGKYYKETDKGKTWDIENPQQQKLISTLSHEFQHMIAFYQKVVKNNSTKNIDVWLNESCSLGIEDLLAQTLNLNGPRGRVEATCNKLEDPFPIEPNKQEKLKKEEKDRGRLNLFNQIYDSFPIFTWSSSVENYHTSYSFIAYLLRNYGGATLLHNIVNNQSLTYKTIEQVTKVDLVTLQRRWAVACLLSDTTEKVANDKLLFNNGSEWLNCNYNQKEYKLGSINLFNIYPPLKIYDATQNRSVSIGNKYLGLATNRICKIGNKVTGKLHKQLSFEHNIQATVVVKKAK